MINKDIYFSYYTALSEISTKTILTETIQNVCFSDSVSTMYDDLLLNNNARINKVAMSTSVE